MRIPRVPPPIIGAAAALAQVWCARGSKPSAASIVAGSALASTSAWILVDAARTFRRADTTVSPLAVDDATAVVRNGPYRFSRNPMYVGMAGLLLAHAAVRRSWAACLPALAWVAVIDRVQIPAEEKALRAKFPTAYRKYLAQAPRWIGSPRRR